MTDDPPSDLGLPATISAAALRWLLNVSNARLEQLVTAGIVTRTARGQHSITSIRAFVQEQRRARPPGRLSSMRPGLLAARAWCACEDVEARKGRDALAERFGRHDHHYGIGPASTLGTAGE